MASRESETRENNQNRKEGISSKNFIAGAVIGGVVGAAAALFLAPKTGKEMRSDLNSQVNHLLEKTTLLSDDVLEKGNDVAAVTKEKTAIITKAVVQQSKELVNKAIGLTMDHEPQQEENATTYIPINGSNNTNNQKGNNPNQETNIRKKLEEAQKAFEEAENSIKK